VQDFLGDNPSPAECRPKQLGGLAGSSSSAGLARSGPSTTQHSRSSSQGGLAAGTGSSEDEELERAIQLSLQQQQQERPSQSSQSRAAAAPSSSTWSSAAAPTVFDFTKTHDAPAPTISPQPGFSASEVRTNYSLGNSLTVLCVHYRYCAVSVQIAITSPARAHLCGRRFVCRTA
jgi:hypothetical protein